MEQIIDINRNRIVNKKRIFNLNKAIINDGSNNIEQEENEEEIDEKEEEEKGVIMIKDKKMRKKKKINHLRNEAKLLEESINCLKLPSYQKLKNKKFEQCSLFSYHFYKQFFKKAIGKENNYIFNYKDNYLNDMTKIDKSFFEDYFKENVNNFNIINNELSLKEQLNERELIYEFSIYHPFKNTKTQQISIHGSCYLYELKDKIYCVLDEIHSNNNLSFFFIENAFYNDNRKNEIKTLSA